MTKILGGSKKILKLALIFAVAAGASVLTGCADSGQKASSSTTSTTGDSGSSVDATAGGTLILSLIDVTSNTDKNSISLSTATQLRAVLKDKSGNAIPNQVVRFKAESEGILALSPAGSALTDATGIASIFAAPASLTVAGAYTVTAESLVSGISFKAVRNFSIGATNVSISSLTASAPNISAYGTTTLSASVAGLPAGISVKVQFSSTCSSNGRATVTSISDTIKGVATATYKDNACAGSDTVTATVQGTSASSSISVTSNPPAIANIGFVSASPQTIILKGTGAAGASEISIVKFKVFDQSGQPYTVPTAVTFNLSTFTGGLLLDNASSSVTKPSNGVGEVEVVVSAGTLPTPVTVKASIVDPVSGALRNTESIKLNVSTGRPTQNSFSLSASAFNIEGWNYDGTKSKVTVRAADRLANPVPDGTAINLIAEGGSIGATCQTNGGACSVDFISQESRPGDGNGSPSTSINRTSNGRVTVLAYSIGEESFVDINANNLYDAGEAFNDLGYIFIDNLETSAYNLNVNQLIPFTTPPGACTNPIVGIFNIPSVPGTCDGKWGIAHVRRAAVFVLSGSTAYLTNPVGGVPVTFGVDNLNRKLSLSRRVCSLDVPFFIQDVNGNPMAAGTKLDVISGEGVSTKAAVSTIADSTARGGSFNYLSISGAKDLSGNCAPGNDGNIVNVTLVVTSTLGTATPFLFSITIVP